MVLPRPAEKGFVEVFDVETSSLGYVAERLIEIMDTLKAGPPQFASSDTIFSGGEVEVILQNPSGRQVFVWINGSSWFLEPHEKKILVFNEGQFTYFASSPGLFPLFGMEVLKGGESYKWQFDE